MWAERPLPQACDVVFHVDLDGTATVKAVTGCPEDRHAEARDRAKPDAWCAWWPDGWPRAYDITEKVILYPPRATGGQDVPQVELRTSFSTDTLP